MKRPVTILNLSDLHINYNNKDGLKALESLAHQLEQYIKDEKENVNFRWLPDYIVMPGDIVDSNAGNTQKSYEIAGEIIKSFTEKFNWDDEKLASVVITPGNHDKKGISNEDLKSPDDITNQKEKYEKNKKNFEQFCGLDKTKNIDSEFINIHEDDFRMFSDFNKQFIPEDNPEFKYHYYPKTGDILKYVSGIKIFHEHKICFLCLNTEWLHTRSAISDKQKIGLCRPIVKHLCDELRESIYSDYTVITLMHRKLEDLSWETKNHTNVRTQDAMSLIEQYSDIIISGHDHSIRTNSPDMLKNSIQHFKLGSPSCTVTENEKFLYSVSAIYIDPIDLTVELLNGKYDDNNKWEFFKNGTYQLRNKYKKGAGDSDKKSNYYNRWGICLKAKSSGLSDVRQSISSYFRNGGDTTWSLLIKSVDDITDISVDTNKRTHIVLYSLNYEHNNQNHAREEYLKVKSKFRKDILLIKVIVSVVFIDIPELTICR